MKHKNWITVGLLSLSLTLSTATQGSAQSIAPTSPNAAQCLIPAPLDVITIDLPQAVTRESVQTPALVVSLDATGQIYINQLPVTTEQLQQSVQQFQQATPEGQILLAASRSALYDDVVQVLDVLRSSGGDRVGLMVATEPSPTRIPLQIPPPSEPLPTLPPLRPSDRPPQPVRR